MQGPEPLSAHSFQLSVSSGSTPEYPEIGLYLTRNLPTRGLCLQPLWLSKSSRLPSFSLLPAATQTEFHSKQWGEGDTQGRELGGCFQFLLGPLPDFFSIPGTEAHLVEEQPLAASGPTTPGGKPWILDLNRPKREKASCWGGAVPCSHAHWFPNPQDFRKRGPDPPTHRGALQEAIAQEASCSLCKPLGFLHVLCILLAILYPVWEFQAHMRLSFAQPHMCKPKGSVMSLPAGALSLAVNCAAKHKTRACNHTCRNPPPCLGPLRPEAQRPSHLSGAEERCATAAQRLV